MGSNEALDFRRLYCKSPALAGQRGPRIPPAHNSSGKAIGRGQSNQHLTHCRCQFPPGRRNLLKCPRPAAVLVDGAVDFGHQADGFAEGDDARNTT